MYVCLFVVIFILDVKRGYKKVLDFFGIIVINDFELLYRFLKLN